MCSPTIQRVHCSYENKGDIDKAIEYYNKDLALTLEIKGPNHPSTAVTYRCLGIAWEHKGELDKAMDLYQVNTLK